MLASCSSMQFESRDGPWESGGFCEVAARCQARRDLIEAGLNEGADRGRAVMGIEDAVLGCGRCRGPKFALTLALFDVRRGPARRWRNACHTFRPPKIATTGVDGGETRTPDRPCRGSSAGRVCEDRTMDALSSWPGSWRGARERRRAWAGSVKAVRHAANDTHDAAAMGTGGDGGGDLAHWARR